MLKVQAQEAAAYGASSFIRERQDPLQFVRRLGGTLWCRMCDAPVQHQAERRLSGVQLQGVYRVEDVS